MSFVPAKQETCEMDEEDGLWSQLPEDVVANIQARLPLVRLVQSRTVCKGWNAAFASPWLLQERLEARGGERDCMVCVVGYRNLDIVCFVYDRASNCWYQIQLPRWLLDEEGRAPVYTGKDSVHDTLQRPATSAGGSVLVPSLSLSDEDVGWDYWAQWTMHLGNPVAGSWTTLPAISDAVQIHNVLGVFQDAQTKCFKLLAQDADEVHSSHPVQAYVFDSALGRWSATSSVMEQNDMVKFLSDQAAFVGSALYFLAGRSCHLLAYNLEHASWSSLEVAKPEFFDVFNCHIINVRERLLCVALCLDSRMPVCLEASSMQIWELDFARMTWTEVDAMPDLMYVNHFRKIYPCCATGQLGLHFPRIMVVTGQDSEVYIMHNELDKVVAVDLRRKPSVWRLLPSYPCKRLAAKSLYRLDPWLD